MSQKKISIVSLLFQFSPKLLVFSVAVVAFFFPTFHALVEMELGNEATGLDRNRLHGAPDG